MKEIKAYIREDRLRRVVHALHEIEDLTGMSSVDGHGFGRSLKAGERHGMKDDLELLTPHAKVEVVCPDDLAAEVIATIEQHAYTGLRGDGKIYVTAVEDAVRIATGERGETAV